MREELNLFAVRIEEKYLDHKDQRGKYSHNSTIYFPAKTLKELQENFRETNKDLLENLVKGPSHLGFDFNFEEVKVPGFKISLKKSSH